MTPELLGFIERYGLPLVGLVVLAIVYHRLQQEVVKDLRTRLSTSDARLDVALDGIKAGTAATTALTEVVREGFRKEK